MSQIEALNTLFSPRSHLVLILDQLKNERHALSLFQLLCYSKNNCLLALSAFSIWVLVCTEWLQITCGKKANWSISLQLFYLNPQWSNSYLKFYLQSETGVPQDSVLAPLRFRLHKMIEQNHA